MLLFVPDVHAEARTQAQDHGYRQGLQKQAEAEAPSQEGVWFLAAPFAFFFSLEISSACSARQWTKVR
jgi:hypothetical protein